MEYVMSCSKYRKYEILVCGKCGKQMNVRTDYLKKHSGICMSCQKKNNKFALKHGDYNCRLYHIWQGIFNRKYKRKPSVCEEWKEYSLFKKWAIENGYRENLTLDRINNYGDYEPSNCQWIPLKENAGKDKKIFTHEQKIELYNLRKKLNITQIDMAKKCGVSRNTIQRLEKEIKQCQ